MFTSARYFAGATHGPSLLPHYEENSALSHACANVAGRPPYRSFNPEDRHCQLPLTHEAFSIAVEYPRFESLHCSATAPLLPNSNEVPRRHELSTVARNHVRHEPFPLALGRPIPTSRGFNSYRTPGPYARPAPVLSWTGAFTKAMSRTFCEWSQSFCDVSHVDGIEAEGNTEPSGPVFAASMWSRSQAVCLGTPTSKRV